MVESCSAAADAHEVVGVDPGVDLAEDGEVGQVDVGAWVGGHVAEDADAIASQHRVPLARAGQRHVVDDQVRGDGVVARRDVDRLAFGATGVDRVLDGGCRVRLAGRVRPVGQHRDRARRLRRGRRDLLEVRDVDRDRDRRVGDLEPDLRPGRQGPAEQGPHVVVHVVTVEVGRVVGERVAPVEPVVHRGEGQVRPRVAVHEHLQRRRQPGAVGRVGDGVAEVDRVRRLGEGEVDVLPGPAERDRGAAHGLGRQRVEVSGRADHGAVGRRPDSRVLGERDGSATAVIGGWHHSGAVVAGIRCGRGAGRSRPRRTCQCHERSHGHAAGESSCEHGPPLPVRTRVSAMDHCVMKISALIGHLTPRRHFLQ